jgi:hypothetical protein
MYLIAGLVAYLVFIVIVVAIVHDATTTAHRLDDLAPRINTATTRPPRLTNTRAEFERARTNNWK